MIKKQEQDPRIRFGEWLDVTMRAHGYTSDLSLARELEIHHSTIGRWRKGDVPDLPQLRKLARLFHVPLSRLIILAGHAEPEEMDAAQVSPEELDPIVRLIQKSPIDDERKMKLLDEWYRRLIRERQIMEADVQKGDDLEYSSYSGLQEASRNMYAEHVLNIVQRKILDDENNKDERKTRK